MNDGLWTPRTRTVSGLRWRRVSPGPWPIMRADYPDTKAYQADVADGHLSVFVGQEPAGHAGEILWHISISHRTNTNPPKPGRYPTWDEIRAAREAFTPDEVTMALLLPPRAEYVNTHPTTFHLWEVAT